jgi:hypothetical protein
MADPAISIFSPFSSSMKFLLTVNAPELGGLFLTYSSLPVRNTGSIRKFKAKGVSIRSV